VETATTSSSRSAWTATNRARRTASRSGAVRLSVVVLLAACFCGAFAQSADSALFFLFKPTLVAPGQFSTIRPAGTPATFKQSQRTRPFHPAMQLFLVLNDVAAEVTSPDDPRLHPIGSLVVGKKGTGILRFKVPQLPEGDYAAAVVCPGCARYSPTKQTFYVLDVGDSISAYWRPLMLLRVRARVDDWTSLRRQLHVPHLTASGGCPVADSAQVVDRQALNGREPAFLMGVGYAPPGVIYMGAPDATGWRGQKTPWLVPLAYDGPVLVRGVRVDRAGPMRFAKGYGEHLTELRYASGENNGTSAGHRFLAGTSLFRAAGCYAFQIDGTSFSRVVVMRVRG
jgi:hypothetical protein